jgi:hypothetical protein
MAITTFNDENTFCPSVPRKKGRAALISAKTNMANTTFNDENTFCLPCNKADTMVNVRKRVTMDIAREIYYKAVFSRGGQPQSAYDETCTFLYKHYADDVALFLANKIERELAIDQTFTPTRKSEEYIIPDPKLTKIRDGIAAEMRSMPCYHRNPFLCEYLIKSLAVTQHDDRPVHFILKCPLQDSRGGHSLGCGGHSLPGHEHEICDCCSVRNLTTLNRPVFSHIRYGNPISNFSVSNFRSRCPTLDNDFQRCPPCTREEATDQASQLNLYAEVISRISGFRLTVATLAGSRSNVGLILEQLNTKYIDYCSATTHVQNLSTPIRGFHPEYQRRMVMKTLRAISYHVYPHCATDTLLEASLDDKNIIFGSRKPLKSNVKISILDIIARCYRDGHQLSPLLTIPNQYDDDFFFKSQLEGLINRKMVDIVRVANEKRKSCEEEYTETDMTVHSLAVWHSYLGLHARWVLGVRHDKERGARKRKKLCIQEGCDNQVVQGGVCKQHGASVKRCSQDGCDNQVVQGGFCKQWGECEAQKTLQPRRVR